MFEGGELRTFRQIQDLAASYQEAVLGHTGKRKLSSKDFKSCEHPPLFESEMEDFLDKFIVQVVPPMELHILLGLANDAIKELEQELKALKFEVTLARWYQQCRVKKSQYHGGQFNGNMTKRVLQGVPRLRMLLCSDLTPVVDALLQAEEQLDIVRHGVFGQTLNEGFERDIKILGELWLKAGLSVTPKAHILFVHVRQFLNFNNPQQGPRRGLGFWSEQASESVHHDFEVHWESGYKRPISLREDYKVQALLCISTYAARHI